MIKDMKAMDLSIKYTDDIQDESYESSDSSKFFHIRGLVIDWDRIDPTSYLRSIPAISGLERLDFNKSITFFVGENGSGKSTLLEAIAVEYGFNPEGGT